MELFSIVVPIYMVEKYLPICIESILQQTYTAFQLILVDDGSLDQCPQICDEYARKDNRVMVIHQANNGPAAARNSGIRAAKGEYLCFLDPDDYWSSKDFLKNAAEALKRAQVDVLAFGATRRHDGKSDGGEKVYAGLDFINLLEPQNRVEALVKHDLLSISAWMHILKTEYIRNHDLFFDESYKNAEDIEWFLRLLSYKPIIEALDSTQYVYRVRPNSICTQKKATGSWKYRYNAIVSGTGYMLNSKLDESYKNAVIGYITYQYFLLIAGIIDEPDKEEKRKAIKKCRELLFLSQYAVGRKAKACKIIINVFGFNVGARLLNLRTRKRKQIK